MKKTILALSILAINATVIAQDTMRMNTNISGRVAARDMRGATDPPALPVLETFVPQEAASLASGKYGKALYSVKQLRVASGDSAYQVTLMDSGQTRLEWIGGDGAMVTNIYRVDTGDMATENQMDSNNNRTIRDTAMNNMNNLNNTTGDTTMKKDTMNMNNRDTMNMKKDTMNMNNRDTSLRNMDNMNIRDTATKRDTMNRNGTSSVEINKMSGQGKLEGDSSIALFKIGNQMKFLEHITFIRRRIGCVDC
jgi:hypothetical protein